MIIFEMTERCDTCLSIVFPSGLCETRYSPVFVLSNQKSFHAVAFKIKAINFYCKHKFSFYLLCIFDVIVSYKGLQTRHAFALLYNYHTV